LAENALLKADLLVFNKLRPNKMVADLNGDGNNDIILFVESNKSKKKGLCILLSSSDSCMVIGAGKKFYAGGDDFRWVDHWEIIPPGETWETTFKPDGDIRGEKKVILKNKSIRLCVDEGGCGVVAFIGGEYIWVHQGD
jgi:hypothetical protein